MIGIIIPSTFMRGQVDYFYCKPLHSLGHQTSIFVLPKGKTLKANSIKEWIQINKGALEFCDILLICDTAVFKVIVKQQKASETYGYVFKSPYLDTPVSLGIAYTRVTNNPELQERLNQSLETLDSFLKGTYKEPGADCPERVQIVTEIAREGTLNYLSKQPALTVDIEATSLDFYNNKLISIAFGVSETEAYAFDSFKGIKEFFESYKGKTIYHNAGFDIKVLIKHLFMKSLTDYTGLYRGLEVMYRDWECTQIISYLALNTCGEVKYSLKSLAQEFAGNWALDPEEINTDNLEETLIYNGIDTLSTWYVYNKYLPRMLEDKQEDVYENLFKPSQVFLTLTEIVGMPVDLDIVSKSRKELEISKQQCIDIIKNSKYVQEAELLLRGEEILKRNASYKKKVIGLEDAKTVFNISSPKHLIKLLYSVLEFPVIDTTATGQPATGADTLNNLKNYTEDSEIIELIEAINNHEATNKILSTFIPALEKAVPIDKSYSRLFGNFRLGGTVSGRLSSNNPNLTNIPSGSKLAKYIKQCFVSNDEWIFVGADFQSLEDKINALLTKDKNKLKVYTDGYDSHSLRSFYYFRDELPDIEETIESINSIQSKYPSIRQASKAPTFALSYLGTYLTLMRTLGWDKEKAQMVENRFHELYSESFEWIQNKFKQAARDGYLELAFGLRLRTPLMAQCMWGTDTVPKRAHDESRTVGNAVSGQSYGMLTNRAGCGFMKRVVASGKHLDIFPVAQIHDALYFVVRNTWENIKFINDNLIPEMEWQELPEIKHDHVKLSAQLELYIPDWNNPCSIPNHASIDEIQERVKQHYAKLSKE